MRIRDYTPADREACLAVFDSNVPEFFVTAEREDFAAFLDTLPGPYYVLEDDAGAVLGCGGYALEPGTTRASLCWGMVRRERHRTGLGRLLFEERLARIRADGLADVVGLDTSQHTRTFYEQYGFATLRVVPDAYAPGLDRCDMRLALRGHGGAQAAGEP